MKIDKWMSLGDKLELNVFSYDDGSIWYAVYPVLNGEVNMETIVEAGVIIEGEGNV